MKNTEDNLMREARALSERPIEEILKELNLAVRARAILILIDTGKDFDSSSIQSKIYCAFPEIKKAADDEIAWKMSLENPQTRKSPPKWPPFVEKLREACAAPHS